MAARAEPARRGKGPEAVLSAAAMDPRAGRPGESPATGRRMPAGPARGCWSDLPQDRLGRTALRRPRRHHPGHRRGHRPSSAPGPASGSEAGRLRPPGRYDPAEVTTPPQYKAGQKSPNRTQTTINVRNPATASAGAPRIAATIHHRVRPRGASGGSISRACPCVSVTLHLSVSQQPRRASQLTTSPAPRSSDPQEQAPRSVIEPRPGIGVLLPYRGEYARS